MDGRRVLSQPADDAPRLNGVRFTVLSVLPGFERSMTEVYIRKHLGAGAPVGEFESREAAWAEMTKVCGDLLGSLARSLRPNAEWQMELLDEAKQPVFRIRLVAESMS